MLIAESASDKLDAKKRGQQYVRPPQPIHFPASEEMPETNRHLELRTILYLILKRAFKERATIGSEQFVYYDPTNAKKNLAPDVFVKLDIPHKTFRVWKVWQRGAPDVAVEVVSDSDEAVDDWNEKLERYRASGIAEVVRFDADDKKHPIRVWDHVDGDLVERLSEDGVFECAALGLYWVPVPDPDLDMVLRLARDRAGRDLLLTPTEAEKSEARGRADEARGRADEARGRMEAEKARDTLAAEVAELRKMLEQQTTTKKNTKKRTPSTR
jgi:Uma2 family endonuclease